MPSQMRHTSHVHFVPSCRASLNHLSFRMYFWRRTKGSDIAISLKTLLSLSRPSIKSNVSNDTYRRLNKDQRRMPA